MRKSFIDLNEDEGYLFTEAVCFGHEDCVHHRHCSTQRQIFTVRFENPDTNDVRHQLHIIGEKEALMLVSAIDAHPGFVWDVDKNESRPSKPWEK